MIFVREDITPLAQAQTISIVGVAGKNRVMLKAIKEQKIEEENRQSITQKEKKSEQQKSKSSIFRKANRFFPCNVLKKKLKDTEDKAFLRDSFRIYKQKHLLKDKDIHRGPLKDFCNL